MGTWTYDQTTKVWSKDEVPQAGPPPTGTPFWFQKQNGVGWDMGTYEPTEDPATQRGPATQQERPVGGLALPFSTPDESTYTRPKPPANGAGQGGGNFNVTLPPPKPVAPFISDRTGNDNTANELSLLERLARDAPKEPDPFAIFERNKFDGMFSPGSTPGMVKNGDSEFDVNLLRSIQQEADAGSDGGRAAAIMAAISASPGALLDRASAMPRTEKGMANNPIDIAGAVWDYEQAIRDSKRQRDWFNENKGTEGFNPRGTVPEDWEPAPREDALTGVNRMANGSWYTPVNRYRAGTMGSGFAPADPANGVSNDQFGPGQLRRPQRPIGDSSPLPEQPEGQGIFNPPHFPGEHPEDPVPEPTPVRPQRPLTHRDLTFRHPGNQWYRPPQAGVGQSPGVYRGRLRQVPETNDWPMPQRMQGSTGQGMDETAPDLTINPRYTTGRNWNEYQIPRQKLDPRAIMPGLDRGPGIITPNPGRGSAGGSFRKPWESDPNWLANHGIVGPIGTNTPAPRMSGSTGQGMDETGRGPSININDYRAMPKDPNYNPNRWGAQNPDPRAVYNPANPGGVSGGTWYQPPTQVGGVGAPGAGFRGYR